MTVNKYAIRQQHVRFKWKEGIKRHNTDHSISSIPPDNKTHTSSGKQLRNSHLAEIERSLSAVRPAASWI